MHTDAKTRVMLPQAKNARSQQEWREEDLESRRRQADVRCQKACFCCFHPSGLGDFVPAAPGHCVST